MTDEVEISLFRYSFQVASEAKKRQCPRMFLMLFRDEMIDGKGTLKLVSYLSGKGRYLTLKSSNIGRSKKAVTYLRPLIDKQPIKLTDTCFLGSL